MYTAERTNDHVEEAAKDGPSGKMTFATVCCCIAGSSDGEKVSGLRGGGGCRSSCASLAAGNLGVFGCERLEPVLDLDGCGKAGGDVGFTLDGTDSSMLRVSLM